MVTIGRAFNLSCFWFLTTLAISFFSADSAAISLGTLDTPTVVRAEDTTRPPQVPAGYLITPNGYFHPTCVQPIEPDETLKADGSVVRDGGGRRHIPPCSYARYTKAGERIGPQTDLRPAQPLLQNCGHQISLNGGSWIIDADTILQNGSANYFSGRLGVVPSAPSVQTGQSIFLFIGLEDCENVQTVLQPVLGWNGFNQNVWTISAWNCCISGNTNYTGPYTVHTGYGIEGTISTSDGLNWTVYVEAFDGLFTHPYFGSRLAFSSATPNQGFDWVFGAVLESYGVTQCSQYPSDQHVFSQLYLTTLSGPELPSWQRRNDSNNLGCASITNIASDTITLSY